MAYVEGDECMCNVGDLPRACEKRTYVVNTDIQKLVYRSARTVAKCQMRAKTRRR
jgi:hypothetical protein